MKQKLKFQSNGSLTIIAIIFLTIISVVVVYRLQMANMNIQSNENRIQHYQKLKE